MRPRRVDTNHADIIHALRRAGATVQSLHTVGKGCPDIIVGYHGINYLIEIKDGSLSPSKRKLTPDEATWHDTWRGQVNIAKSVDEALTLIGALTIHSVA